MADYDYGNARLHAMKSRLLSIRELETLMEAGSLQGLVVALSKTIYQKSVEAALTRVSGMQCVDEALRTDLVDTIRRIKGFYQEESGRVTVLFLQAYDIYNLKTILRGLSKAAPAGDILANVLPVGELNQNTLRELAQLNNPREAIDMLASMGLSYATPLLNVRVEVPGAETFEMELALDKWYFANVHQTLRSEVGEGNLLSRSLALEVDLANVLTALRFAQFPRELDLLRERLGINDVEYLFVGPGNISFQQLSSACSQDTVAAAIEVLSGTIFEPALRAGLERYAHSNRLSDIEKRLRHDRLAWMVGMIKKDPLGIGVVLGYIALKVNEVGNIRWVAQGINLGLKVDAIRANLEVVL